MYAEGVRRVSSGDEPVGRTVELDFLNGPNRLPISGYDSYYFAVS